MPRKPKTAIETLREVVGEEHQELLDTLEDIDGLERSLSTKERKAIPLEDFAWPEQRKYPIDSQEHLDSAATLIGRAPEDEQSKIKARAISIAKRKGFALPKSWQDEDKEDRSISPDVSDSSPSSKDPMTTVERSNLAAPPTKDIQFYVPIERWDKDTREVIGTATQEVEDAYGTVIRYEASKDAFTRWAGNIREMHDKHKAVGRALEVKPDDANKRIIVRATISKGAEDTWQKIVDGTLTGFSIGGRNGTWSDMKIGDRNVPALDRYDLAELSLVDNPGCPGSNDLVIVRSDGEMSQVLALNSEAEVEQSQEAEEAIERVGAKHSADTKEALHGMRDHGKATHQQAAETCGCDECQDHLNALGQIRKSNADDGDGDNDADRVLRYLDPVYQRLQSVIARLAQSENDTRYQEIQRENQELRSQLAELKVMTTELKTALDASVERSATPSPALESLKTEILAMRSEVAATKSQVDKIASQPTSGGPTLNAGSLPSGIAPAEKRFATQGTPQQAPDSVQSTLDRLQAAGILNTPEAQTAAAALAIRPMRGYTG